MAKSKNNRYFNDDDNFDARTGYVPKDEQRRLKKLNNLIRKGSVDPKEWEELGEEF